MLADTHRRHALPLLLTPLQAQSGSLQWSENGVDFFNVGVEGHYIYTSNLGEPLPDAVPATLSKCDSAFMGYNLGKPIGHLTINGVCAAVDLQDGGLQLEACSGKDDATQLVQFWQVGDDGSLVFLGTTADQAPVQWGFTKQGGTPGGTIQGTQGAGTISLAIKPVE